jgi:hypothetical protein
MIPNPYESPRESGPLKIVKRGMGVGAVLLLTPPAVGIAFGISCAAVDSYANATLRDVESKTGAFLAWMIGAWLIFLLPPGVTLAGMIWWAVRAHRRGKRPSEVSDSSNT